MTLLWIHNVFIPLAWLVDLCRRGAQMLRGYTINRPLPATVAYAFPDQEAALGKLASNVLFYGGPSHPKVLSVMHKFTQLEGAIPVGAYTPFAGVDSRARCAFPILGVSSGQHAGDCVGVCVALPWLPLYCPFVGHQPDAQARLACASAATLCTPTK